MPITFYQASAGSGKTTELVNFYLSLCMSESDHRYFKHILAMTFTVKAAQEMKMRVLNVLKKIAAGEQNAILEKLFTDTNRRLVNKGLEVLDARTFRLKANRILSNILHRYSDFSIMTLDAFFNRIVSAFAYDLNIPMDFQIIMNENELLKTAVDKILESIGKDPLLTEFILNYYQSEFEEEKNPDVEKLLLKLKTLIFAEKNIDFVQLLQANQLEDFLKIKMINIQIIKTYENEVHRSVADLEHLIVAHNIDFNVFNRNFVASFIKNAREKNRYSWNETIKKILLGEAPLYAQARLKDQPVEVAKVDAITSILLDSLHKMQTWEADKFPTYVVAKAINKHIEKLALIYDLVKIIQSLKQENNALTFQDISYMISRVISQQHTPFIYERVGVKYHHFLIDEFQDTSVMQFYNVLPLMLESNDEYDNLIVGDAKQAIYRFRNGEVELIRNLPDLIPELKSQVPEYYLDKLKFNFKTISLAKNYRSSETVIEFNNSFFDFIIQNFNFATQVQEIYKTLKQEKIKISNDGYVEVKFLKKSKKSDTENLKEWLSDTILRCKIQNYRYKDLAILLRTNTEIQVVSEILLEQNIPFISSESLTLGSNPQLKCIFSAFQILKNPMDNLAMLEVIHYFYQFKNISFEADRLDSKVFVESLANIGVLWKEESFSNKNVLEIFYEMLYTFHFDLNTIFIHQLHDFFIQNGAKWLHISDVLDWWEEDGNRIFISLPEEHDAVKIMTYHKAKGLEFELVICPFVIEKYMSEDQFILTDDQVYIVSPAEELDTVMDEKIYQQQIQQQTLDNINNLYVAFTRACKRLYIATIEVEESKTHNPKNKLNFAQLLQAFCSMQNTYVFGIEMLAENNLEFIGTHDDTLKNETSFPIFFDWKDALKARNIFQNDEILYGKIFHEYASQINYPKDKEKIFIKIDKDRSIDSEVKSKLKLDLEKMLLDIRYASLLQEPHEVINEKNIYANGEIVRPDKIFLHEEILTIVDFKTGKEKEEHKKQILKYKDVLLKMGFKKVNPMLIYSESIKIIEL